MRRNISTEIKLTTFASILMLCGLVSGTPAIAQHVLYARGDWEVQNMSRSQSYKLQHGVNYPVVGIYERQPIVSTQYGRFVYNCWDCWQRHPPRFRVLNGGQYSSLKIQAVKVKSWLEWFPPTPDIDTGHSWSSSIGTRGGDEAKYEAVLVSPQTIGQCYSALQVYNRLGEVLGIDVKVLGTLNANAPTNVTHSFFIRSSDSPLPSDEVQVAFYVFSGSVELPVDKAENNFANESVHPIPKSGLDRWDK